jgi:hypothetical protein
LCTKLDAGLREEYRLESYGTVAIFKIAADATTPDVEEMLPLMNM